jgi:hypothetical protein
LDGAWEIRTIQGRPAIVIAAVERTVVKSTVGNWSTWDRDRFEPVWPV